MGAGGGGGLTSCPTGFTMIGASGKRGNFCIDTNERAATTWYPAKAVCENLSVAEGYAYMCKHTEWQKACKDGGPNNMTDNNEFVDGIYSWAVDTVNIVGSGSCNYHYADYDYNAHGYRCCIR